MERVLLIALLSLSLLTAELTTIPGLGWVYADGSVKVVRNGGYPIYLTPLSNDLSEYVTTGSSGACSYGWWSQVLGASDAIGNGINGEGVKVLIIDSGVDDNVLNEALGRTVDYHFNAAYEVYKDYCEGNVTVKGVDYCYIYKEKVNSWLTEYIAIPLDNVDELGHGTAVAATILSVAPNVTLYSAKVTLDVLLVDDQGNLYSMDVFLDPLAVNWALSEAVYGPDGIPGTSDDADIVNMSLGTVVYPLPSVLSALDYDTELQLWYLFKLPIQKSYEKVLFVAAAGNEGDRVVSIPAIIDEVAGVSALEYANGEWKLANFSSTGFGVDFASLGSGLYLPVPKYSLIARLIDDTCGSEGNYTKWVRLDGTSFAAPLVAGIAALWEQYSGQRGVALFDVLANHTIDVLSPGKDLESGYGVPIAPYYTATSTNGSSTSSIPAPLLASLLGVPLMPRKRRNGRRKTREEVN